LETLTRGRSLGKMAVGLRVVRVDGGPIRFRHALVRGLAGFVVDFWALGLFGAVAVIVSLCSSDGRRVGDFLAGTLVVRERVPESAGYPAIGMPPGLAGWASQLDLTRLPDDLALASRQFLARFGELRPEASHALGWGLAQQVGNALGAAVPPGVPPWAFLAAVLAERRNRDHAKAFQAYAAAQAQQAQAVAARGYAVLASPDQPAFMRAGYSAAAQSHEVVWGRPATTPGQANPAQQPYAGQPSSQPVAPEYSGSSEPTPPRGIPAAPAENPFTPPS
jgi:hypothetical protein